MFFRAPCQRRVAGRKKDQMVEVGAGQTQRAFLTDERDPGFGAEIFATLAADGFAVEMKTLSSSVGLGCEAISSFKSRTMLSQIAYQLSMMA